jgi:hypothetical protein
MIKCCYEDYFRNTFSCLGENGYGNCELVQRRVVESIELQLLTSRFLGRYLVKELSGHRSGGGRWLSRVLVRTGLLPSTEPTDR